MGKVNHYSSTSVIRALIMVLIVCYSIPPVFAQGERNEPGKGLMRQQLLDQIVVDKSKFVEGLVGRWSSLTEDHGAELRAALLSLSNDRLAEASGADTWEALDRSIYDPDNLGDRGADLVFNKVTPCRIIDTRVAGGILIAGAPRDFDGNGPFDGQGGSTTNCGLPSSDPAALVLTIVAVDPLGKGNLRAYPHGATPPTAVVINYDAGFNLANTTIVPLNQSSKEIFEFTVSANVSNSHLVADVVGYFSAPVPTPVDCVTQLQTVQVTTGNTWGFQTLACETGRTLAGGGVIINGCSVNVWTFRNSPDATNTAWRTEGLNACGLTIDVLARARCCRIPGL